MARVKNQDIERRFPDQGPHSVPNTAIALSSGYSGEIVTISLCGLNPRKPDQVANLIIKRAALYSPLLTYRWDIKHQKRRGRGQRATDDKSVSTRPNFGNRKVATLIKVRDLRNVSSLKQFHYILDTLIGFYSSRMKKMNWERKKPARAEKVWAVEGCAPGRANGQPEGHG
jgi:hypothetical protein